MIGARSVFIKFFGLGLTILLIWTDTFASCEAVPSRQTGEILEELGLVDPASDSDDRLDDEELLAGEVDAYRWRISHARALAACGHDEKLSHDVAWLNRYLSSHVFGARTPTFELYVDRLTMAYLFTSVLQHQIADEYIQLAVEELCRLDLTAEDIAEAVRAEVEMASLLDFWISPPALLSDLETSGIVLGRLDARNKKCVLALIENSRGSLEHLGPSRQGEFKTRMQRLRSKLDKDSTQ